MKLTQEEQKMLDGSYGPSVQKCMKVLVTLGEIYGAQEMIEVTNVHSPGVSYRVAGNAGLNYVKDTSLDAEFRAFTTLNTIGIDEVDWQKVGFPDEFSQKQLELCAAYEKMGAVPVNTCTPYLTGNLPRFGEHIAWGESSAIVFVNSVLGARTNREGGPTALAAAVTGRVPAYGFHLDENRRGKYLIQVEREPRTDKDFAVLGYFVGKIAGKEVPVIEGIKKRPTVENYKAMGAAMASSGAVALFHLVGFTPEAPTREAVLDADVEPVVFGQREYDETCAKFDFRGTIDFVVLGCPHTSIVEMQEIAELLAGHQVQSGFWVCTSRQVKLLAERMGFAQTITAAGGEIICDTCPVLCYTLHDRGYSSVATNSGKMAHYAPGHWNLQPVLLNTEECVQAALTGKWEGQS